MAVTSGTCYSSYARNTRLKIYWEKYDQWSDSTGCGSKIKWKLQLENGNQWYSNAIKCYAIYINGSKVHDGGTWSNYTSSGTYDLIGWQYTDIAHNNAGNEKTFNINFSGWFYSSYNVSGSQDFTLPSIPRYTTITTFTVSKRNSNSFSVAWGTADTVNKVEYSTNNGSSFINAGVSEGKSGNFTISGLSPSTSYSCKIRVTRKDSGLTTTSNTVTQSTYAKPTQSLRSKTETTIAMNWSCDTTANYLWYSTNGGSSWVAVGSVNATSGYYTISGLSPATTYNVATKIRRSANNIEDATTSGNQKTYAVPTQTFKSKTETTVTMQWNCDSTVDYVWYSTNNGSSWTAVGSVNATSGTYTISGLSAGGTYNIKTRVRRKDTQTTYDTAVNQQITFSYPYCKTAPDFTIGNNVTLTFYNPLNRDVQLQMWSHVSQTFINSTIISARPADGANYTFPASDYKDNLYATIPNNQSSKYNIDVWYGTNKAIKEGGSYTVNPTDCVPTFPDFAYKDTTDNLLTQAIDDDQVIVQNVSNVNVVISSANKMVARKSATASKYAATFSNLSNQNIPYSESDIDTNLGVPTGKGSQTFRVIAYDSRNLSAEKIKTIDVKEYAAPIVNVSLERLNNFEDETHLTVAGNFSKVTVNDVDKNAIEQVRYRFKEQGGSFGSWNTMTIQSQGSGSYRTTQATETCDKTKQFIFEIEVRDRAKTTTINQTLSIGQPLMFLHTNGMLDIQKGLNSGKADGTGEFYIKGQHGSQIYWKENDYGDKFQILADFGGFDDSNKLKIRGAVGGQGTDPALYDLMSIGAKTGYTWHKGNVEVKKSVNEDTMFTVTKTDTNTSMSLAVSQTGNGTLHGLYSWKLNKWIVVADGANNTITLNGDITGKWNGMVNDQITENNIATWIPVINNGKLQHTTKTSIFTTGANVENDTTATVTSGYFGQIDVNRVIKTGKTVQFIFRGFVSSYIPDNTTIFTMPYSAKAGNANAFMYGIGTEYNVTGVKWGYLGNVMHTTSVNSGNWIHINHTYICD